jgi:hypothetical protein
MQLYTEYAALLHAYAASVSDYSDRLTRSQKARRKSNFLFVASARVRPAGATTGDVHAK